MDVDFDFDVEFDVNLNVDLVDSAVATSEHLGEHGHDAFEQLDTVLVR